MGSGERSTGQNIFMTRSHDFQVLKGIKSTFPPQKFHIDLDARKFPYFKFLHLFQSIGALYGLSHCSPPLHTLAETGYENKIFQTLFLTSMKMHSRIITTPPISTAHIQISQECSSITISFFRPRENIFMIHHSFGSKFDQRIREYHITWLRQILQKMFRNHLQVVIVIILATM